MFSKFIEWSEGNVTRGRKVVLFSTVFVYLLVVLLLFISGLIWPTIITPAITNIFMIVTGLMASIYAFYTSTSSDKSSKLADKAADIMMSKLDKLNIKDR